MSNLCLANYEETSLQSVPAVRPACGREMSLPSPRPRTGMATSPVQAEPVVPPRRYERFEPVTVRAAARVLRLRRSGVVSTRDAGFYLHELLVMDAHAGPEAFYSLIRAARRRPCSRRPNAGALVVRACSESADAVEA